MKELQEILEKTAQLSADQKAILATVVDVKGSSYRLPGAKMLILENGDTFGTVSGGCLEVDVLERARKVLKNGRPQIFVYDTTDELDSVFSLNMGCRGVIRILLEPVRNNKLLDFLRNCYEKNLHGIAATLISGDKTEIGKRLFFNGNGFVTGDLKYEQILKDLQKTDKSFIKKYDFGELFFEYIAPPVELNIFGAGADAVPLAEIAKNLGWRVSVFDHRTAFVNRERFANADEIIISRPENAEQNIKMSENSVAVVMTHNYEHDKNLLQFLLKSNAKYVGSLGPKHRAENILEEFSAAGISFSAGELEKLYAPVGLDIGADTPEAIALSIIAEIQAVLSKRNGGFLRDRKGSIYARDEQ